MLGIADQRYFSFGIDLQTGIQTADVRKPEQLMNRRTPQVSVDEQYVALVGFDQCERKIR